MNKFTAISNITLFLQEQTNSIFGVWSGRLPAKTQREMFGKFLGKGTITIDGENETLKHTVSRCFGLDYEHTTDIKWNQI